MPASRSGIFLLFAVVDPPEPQSGLFRYRRLNFYYLRCPRQDRTDSSLNPNTSFHEHLQYLPYQCVHDVSGPRHTRYWQDLIICYKVTSRGEAPPTGVGGIFAKLTYLGRVLFGLCHPALGILYSLVSSFRSVLLLKHSILLTRDLV